MSRRSGNGYSGARYLFAQNQRRETQTTSGGEGLTLMGSSQDRKATTTTIIGRRKRVAVEIGGGGSVLSARALADDDEPNVVEVEYVPASHLAAALALVENYAGHRDTCNIVSGAPECNCGFDDAYAAFRISQRETI